MYFGPFLSGTGFLVLFGALVLSVLLYLKNFREKIVPIANLSWLLVFLASLTTALYVLAMGLVDPREIVEKIGLCLLMNLYAGVLNVVARVWARVAELMGNKRLKVRIHAEIVER